MDFRYDNSADASMQLNDTVMMSDNGPVYLRQYDDWVFEVSEIANYDTEHLDIREIGLTFEPLILGYVNYGAHVAYLGRRPIRMWKAGLSYDNVRAISGHMDDDILHNPALSRCLTNDYPSLKEVFVMVSVNQMDMAFHRDVALLGREGDEIGIAYKGMPVGHIDDNNGNFLINDKYEYLKEVLEEIVNGNA